jgi:ribosomal-protein-alanine N-acetyltransferase
MSLVIRPAEQADLPAIEAIEKLCFSVPWTWDQLLYQLTDPDFLCLAAEGSFSSLLGYIGCLTVLDEGYITNIAVHPNSRRRGVGDALITALIECAEKMALSFLTLEVRESNAAAIALYAKHGFEPVGRRRDYYVKPKEDALLMTKLLNPTQPRRRQRK